MNIFKKYNKEQLSWALFDWANQPFFTVVTTFIFAPYFANHVMSNSVEGQAIWGYINASIAVTIALFAPIFGAIADVRGPRKPWIGVFSLLCAISAFGLWYATPQGNVVIPILSLMIACFAIEMAVIFNNAMLPTLITQNKMGRLSGLAWGTGYIGGIVALLIIMVLFIFPDVPAFGLNKETFEPERLSGPFSAVWLLFFALPMFLFTSDIDKSNEKIPSLDVVKLGFSNLKETLKNVKKHQNIWHFLIARALYNDGVLAIISFSGIYAMAIFGWTTTSLGIFAIIVNIIAFFGCIIGGRVDNKFGSKSAINISVWVLLIGLLGILSINKDSVLYGLIVFEPNENTAFMSTYPQQWFMLFGIMLGLGFGPAQSASRTMMARITPKDKITQFFGLYAFSGKATSFLAPLAIAFVTTITGDNRLGLSVILFFFLSGLIILYGVKEK